jgi:NAD(P) transhydrogenase subunit alpha
VRDRRWRHPARAHAAAAGNVETGTINRGVRNVSQELVLGIYVFIMAIFVGFEVISRVPSVLHTPLMSGTNAIHGIVVLGAMLVAGSADTPLLKALGFIAVVFGAANVFGGFVVTDRMLEMFKKREVESPKGDAEKKQDA